ncbi:unnamed protein product [Ranitomeya imitator]|uniref:Uncharacterized protein n=1 Tax=Ranitomeya imitator TaxID=111125 RepID=A0ABN9MN58_9NEOB|nr:unnamed protein product [Ranitomeya imitator]
MRRRGCARRSPAERKCERSLILYGELGCRHTSRIWSVFYIRIDLNKEDPGKHTQKGGKNISKTIHSEEIGTKQNPLNCMLANARSLTNKMEELEAEISTGVLCTINIDDCERNPCENGATCEDGVADYTCKCPAPWGGKNCSIELLGCINHSCQNGAMCIPTYEEEIHAHSCKCQPGFYGQDCSTPTTFSFSSSGYVIYELEVSNNSRTSTEDTVHMAVRFRTTLPDVVLLYRGNETSYLILELFNGLLQVLYKNGNSSSVVVINKHYIDDGDWHKAEVTLNSDLHLLLHHENCTNGTCSHFQPLLTDYDPELPKSFTKVYIGGLTQDSLLDNTQSKQNFTGCLEDLTIDSRVLLPQHIGEDQSYDITLGCNKTDWCQSSPCHHGSKCIDRWINHECACVRPYTGPTCLEEYTPGTFFGEDIPSFANFTITQNLCDTFNISAFIRTRKPDGLVLQISNGTTNYLTIYLKSGQIHIKLLSETISFKEYISNGKKHMINIFIKGLVKLNINTFEEELEQLPPISISAEHTVLVGGMPPGENIEQWGGYFKGCLQDVRIKEKRLEFFSLDSEDEAVYPASISNVRMNCVSDDVCQSSPCKNNGICTVTWNDFTCKCSANFTGPTCEEPVWCQQRPCPPESTCKDFTGGYTCLVNATFKEESSVIFTSHNSSEFQVASVSLDFRTRDTDAVLLEASKDLDYISIFIQAGRLLITLHSGNSVEGIRFDSKITISDALWHRVQITMAVATDVSSQWIISLDGHNMALQANGGSLNFLLADTAVNLAKNYTGCLGQVSIGDLYLPFADQSFPQHFIKTEVMSLELGCQGEDMCNRAPCQHGGQCQDLFNSFSCTCPSGWEGVHCELNIDDCKSKPCAHGSCYDLENGYRCDCSSGYTGENCEINVDDCQHHQCLHGGSCLDGVNSYTCRCPTNYVGAYCECQININDCEPNPCLNGGACQDSVNNYKCICNASFSGVRCEVGGR